MKKNLFTVLLVILMIAALMVSFTGCSGQDEESAARITELEQENAALQENINNLDTVQGVEQIARDELGLVDPDTVLIQPGD